MSDHKHTEGNDMATAGQEATTPPLKSALNPSPKGNQIDDILHKFLGYTNAKIVDKQGLKLTKVALATAIRGATPGQLTEFHGQGTMQLEATVHQAAIDQFLANLKDSGLEV